ncbi:DUF550 domain-containing protein [Pseudomonas sp. RIT-PI-AD]|uniref:DUF550 domain-containing protein n=1 Tax=Pseudomonas sp. RIT-PI-AD TaxID=3035294 RepID=UPI0021DB5504|nr:DUF550 domain-containing protein [Pseudomonas sp. RIT-PI-AD]
MPNENRTPLQPAPVERDEKGWWTHPEYEEWLGDRERITSAEFDAWYATRAITIAIRWMDGDVTDDQFKSYFEQDCDCSSWQPTPPCGAGWFLLSIHDTEDGPVSLWARPAPGADLQGEITKLVGESAQPGVSGLVEALHTARSNFRITLEMLDAIPESKWSGHLDRAHQYATQGRDLTEQALAAWRAQGGQQPLVSDNFRLEHHLLRQRDFSERTFGPGPRVAGVLDHIRKELLEIEENPGDLTEWIDVVILALDGAWRTGATPSQIIEALVAKQEKNEARSWPDWRSVPVGCAIEHDRTNEPIDDSTYFVMRNAGNKVFVKHGPFFVSQDGLTQDWGKGWTRIKADSIEHARQIGEGLLP